MKMNRVDWRKHIRDYRFRSVFVKNVLVILLAITIPFIGFISITLYAIKNTQSNEWKLYTNRVVTQITADVNSLLQETREKILLLSGNEDVKLFFFTDLDSKNVFYDSAEISESAKLLSATTSGIENIYIYSFRNQKIFSKSGVTDYTYFYDPTCFRDLKWENGRYQLRYNDRMIGNARTKSLSMYFHSVVGTGYEGVIVVNLRAAQLLERLDYGDEISFEIVQNQEVVFSNDLSMIGEQRQVYFHNEIVGKNNVWVTTEKLMGENLWLNIYVADSAMHSSLELLQPLIFIFIFIMLIITVGVAVYESQKMLSPLEKILALVEAEDSKDLGEAEIPVRAENELYYIMNSINSTISKKEASEEELKKRMILLRKAQAVALQSQINPHFIYNTFETINWSAIEQLGPENDISSMINAFSKILRLSLENTDTFVDLRKEIEYANLYLEIQRVRYEEKFCVLWDVPQELLGCKTIKMILQPILENAICHGIEPYDGLGEIRITVNLIEEAIQIIVADSGVGLPQQEIERLNQEMRDSVIRENKHIGLNNVNQRIVLAFGEKYGVHVAGKLNEGTQVVLRIPYQM